MTKYKPCLLHETAEIALTEINSPERLPNRPEALEGIDLPDSSMRFGKVAVNGSLCHITASFGLRLASLIISDIYRHATEISPNAPLVKS